MKDVITWKVKVCFSPVSLVRGKSVRLNIYTVHSTALQSLMLYDDIGWLMLDLLDCLEFYNCPIFASDLWCRSLPVGAAGWWWLVVVRGLSAGYSQDTASGECGGQQVTLVWSEHQPSQSVRCDHRNVYEVRPVCWVCSHSCSATLRYQVCGHPSECLAGQLSWHFICHSAVSCIARLLSQQDHNSVPAIWQSTFDMMLNVITLNWSTYLYLYRVKPAWF